LIVGLVFQTIQAHINVFRAAPPGVAPSLAAYFKLVS
jgi:hypothetical protein